ncbi:uncharacterized protein B0H18DRAFT_589125 [Fomitopsis serialis]|uniref:uncharacterized protein n=1 Tax=Fomitopsis serialis TaxID=139415 RepID=UPI0020087500|nr:uncharacterized protein B0H18DRAFT_589125 [Neoantrodia serialis]KAH9920622.1 hypothetical protein B0H18DRAFT_589125 [Neoantrodia serialis]
MSNFGIDEAQLVALFMESAAWGMQFVTTAICIYTLVSTSRMSKRPLNIPLLVYAIMLFSFGTLDVAFALHRNIQAFVSYKGQGGPDIVFNQISDYVTVLRSVWNFLAVLVADSALIHRCWIIYGRRWIYVIPSILIWLGGFACACAETYYTSTLDKSTNLAGATKIEPFLNAFIVCGVSLNIVTTSLILYRINLIHRASARYFSKNSGGTTVSSRLQWPELTRILVESAIVYTLSGIVLLIVNFAGSNAVYPTSDINLQIAGIQFDLILIRVNRGIAAEHVEAQTSMQTMQFNLRALDRSAQPPGCRSPSHTIRACRPASARSPTSRAKRAGSTTSCRPSGLRTLTMTTFSSSVLRGTEIYVLLLGSRVYWTLLLLVCYCILLLRTERET